VLEADKKGTYLVSESSDKKGTYLVSERGYVLWLAPESLRFVTESRQTYEEFAAARLADKKGTYLVSGSSPSKTGAMEKRMAERKRRNERTPNRRTKVSQINEMEEAQRRRKAKRAELVKQEKVIRRREKAQEKASRPKMSTGKKLAVCGALVVAVLLFISSGYRIIDLNLNKAVYEKEYEEKLAEKARLEKALSLVDDPEYVEQQARTRFKMLREGEILYVFPEAKGPEAQ